ncbi:IMPACT family protein [Adhaeribacter rhizoryzae]|uniref:YigZ family protein n=1 Tax=Adhaeribacter rhizoryzae TaxID=2607907 RepID=A0A5M6CZ18_9BACT|nr:YigZ family protein [Adhaeribacter rhizoryzae]KAA5539252.1 YigZ family protein [Adhaeribacter rhizoryzae]
MPEASSDVYLTIAAPAEGIYKEKGSKFLAYAYPVSSEEEIKNILAGLRKEYFDARHHCYAYQLGTGGHQYRANDDGEPNHSAGDPILGQIRSAGLTNILVVVIRYFGGIKLGVSGLITAYRTAAAEALKAAEKIEKVETVTLEIFFDYEQMNPIMSLIKEYKLPMLSQDFNINCRLTLSVRKNLQTEIMGKLTGLARVQIL